jgi:hypothetical protein
VLLTGSNIHSDIHSDVVYQTTHWDLATNNRDYTAQANSFCSLRDVRKEKRSALSFAITCCKTEIRHANSSVRSWRPCCSASISLQLAAVALGRRCHRPSHRRPRSGAHLTTPPSPTGQPPSPSIWCHRRPPPSIWCPTCRRCPQSTLQRERLFLERRRR